MQDQECKKHEFSKQALETLRNAETDRVQCIRCKAAFTEQELDLKKSGGKEVSKESEEE